MAENFIYGSLGLIDWNQWQIKAKEAMNDYYCNNCPNNVAEKTIYNDYADRITGVTQNSEIRLADDKLAFHSDRVMDPYIDHPTDLNKIIGRFDDSKVNDPSDIAYYTTLSWRTANAIGSLLTIIDRSQAELLGFDFGSGDDD